MRIGQTRMLRSRSECLLCFVSALVFGMLVLLGPGDVGAVDCTTTTQCSNDTVCQAKPFGLGKECRILRCNTNHECPAERPTCLAGRCLGASAPQNPNTPPGSGTTPGGVGETCGAVKFGQITKQRGCQQGLQCVKGRCQPLAH